MSVKIDTAQNYSKTIATLNHERMLFQLPVILLLSVIMTASLIGNSLVVHVYKSKYKKRTSSYFIMVLAIIDLCSSLCIPFVVFDLANPYIHPMPIMCKITRFIEVLTSTASGLVLVCIAFDRYFHVCYPLRIYSLRQAHALTVVMLTLAVSLSWPMLLLSGTRTIETSLPGVFGEDCSFSDDVYNSIYTLLFQGGLFLAFFITFVIAIVFYGRIFYVICKRRWTTIGEQIGRTKDETSTTESNNHSESSICNDANNRVSANDHRHSLNTETNNSITNGNMHFKKQTSEYSHDISENSIEHNSISLTVCPDQTNSKPLPILEPKIADVCKTRSETLRVGVEKRSISKSHIRTTRTTIILAIVTMSALVGFLPYLTVSLMINFGTYFQPGMSVGEDIAYEFCTKSYFLNVAANPIIYSVMNPAFRRDCAAILKKFTNL